MSKFRTWLLGLLGALILALPLRFAWTHRSEDFAYEYGACRVYLRGQNPYDPAVYQAELEAIFRGPNPFITGSYASAYPPALFLTTAPVCRLPIDSAYAVWNLMLFLFVILLWFCAAKLLGTSPARLEGLLLAAVLASFPGLFHSLVYHRSAVAVLALFAAGLWLWERGLEMPAAFLFGFLAITPQWFAYAFTALVLGKKYKAAAAMSWLAVLQALPYLFGVHPWAEVSQYLMSLSHHSSALAFSDDQSLGIFLYKTGGVVSGADWAFKPFFAPAAGFLIFRKAFFVLSWFALWFLARSKAGLSAGCLAWVPVIGLLGSVYSHNGDQMWIIPALIFWLRLRRGEGGGGLWKPLASVFCLNMIAMPMYGRNIPYQRFFEGFWSLEYLALAWGADALRARNRPASS